MVTVPISFSKRLMTTFLGDTKCVKYCTEWRQISSHRVDVNINTWHSEAASRKSMDDKY